VDTRSPGAESVGRRLGRFFAVDDDWEREGRLNRADIGLGLSTFTFSAVTLELTRSYGALEEVGPPISAQWIAIALGATLLVGRRRWPLTVAILAVVHMFVVGVTMPAIMIQIAMQIVYFAAIFSGVAWARNRREMLIVMGAVMSFLFIWLAWQFALGSGVDDFRRSLGDDADRDFGLVSPTAAALLFTALVNVVYFGGAILIGQLAWRNARQHARLGEQAELLRQQADSVRRRAVLEERLRIARELHDVVAHHVAVIGINAAAARRVLQRDLDAASRALGQIEESSREAVSQMRGLLGALRATEDDEARPQASRAPGPGFADLAGLVAGFETLDFTAAYELVETPPGSANSVPTPVELSICRTVQEALANVRRHSTARRATVVLRVERDDNGSYAEVEVTDDGRPRKQTSGSGLGHLGIRERAALHSGQVDIGPRVTGGYRVRVRLPFGAHAIASEPGVVTEVTPVSEARERIGPHPTQNSDNALELRAHQDAP
jgi:signal transduction histidine kinase